jgi:hypothetical protein
MKKRSQDVMRLPIEQRAEMAFKAAVANAIDEHARLGLPIYIWRNERVVKLSPKAVLGFSKSRRHK